MVNYYEIASLAEWVDLIDKDDPHTIDIHGKTYIRAVRCEDCKFYKQLDGDCPYLGEDGYYNCFPDKDDFCSRGKRKDEVEE